MPDRPYTLLSCGMSIDGYIDDAAEQRLVLSDESDFDRVDEVRASCDAIFVGAATVRNDNPRLLVRSPERQERRAARGDRATPIKVTVTERAKLDATANFFAMGDTDKLVYCASATFREADEQLGGVATVIDGGDPVRMRWVSEDLFDRGIRRLMVEGGGSLHTQFLAAGLADELNLVVAPFFVGDSRGVRVVGDAAFPWNVSSRARLADVTRIGDLVLLRYALSERFQVDPG